MGGKL